MNWIANLPFICKLLRQRHVRKLHKEMKAYEQLKETGQSGRIRETKRSVTQRACTDHTKFSASVFGSASTNAEIIIRQFLIRSVIENRINRPLICVIGEAKTRLHYPLPANWRKVLRNNGVNISELRSQCLFVCYVFARFIDGLFAVISVLYRVIKNEYSPVINKYENYVYFDSIHTSNLPVVKPEHGTSYDIITWYINWKDRVQPLDAITHSANQTDHLSVKNIPVVPVKDAFQWVDTKSKTIQFIYWAFTSVMIAFAGMFSGRWWNALMLREASNAAFVRIANKNSLAKEYLFHNSYWIYRPLWTYDAENAGARITSYFYSTNIEPLQFTGKKIGPMIGWQTATWPHYLVWDEYQKKYLDETVNQKPRISVVGSIGFNAGNGILPQNLKESVAVFDVQPMRESIYYTLGIDFDYYTASTSNNFVEDVFTASQKNGLCLFYKQKREVGKKAHPAYRNLMRRLQKSDDFVTIDPNIAAQEVIAHSVAVISMPYTSTALLGREMGKPSAYYDPNGVLDKNDPGAHEIPVLSGRKELETWLAGLLTDSKKRMVTSDEK